MAGLAMADGGRVFVNGTDLSTLNDRDLTLFRRRQIGLVFQSFNLIPVLTAFENDELPLLLTKLSKAQRRAHVETALSLVGLTDRTSHYPRQLSRGP